MASSDATASADGPIRPAYRDESSRRSNPDADGPIGPAYRDESSRRQVGQEIARLAARQHGVVAWEQLRDLGVSRSSVNRWAGSGRLHPLHRGVYALGHRSIAIEGRWMAAVLACGPRAVLSHRSAAALWGFLPGHVLPVEVTAPNRRGRSPRGIAPHRDASLAPEDRTAVRGIPCASVARTMLDLAAVVPAAELRRALAEAEVLRQLDVAELREVIRRGRGRRGVARLRAAAEELDPLVGLTRSELERRFLDLCRRAGVPAPEVNSRLDVGGRRVEPDFLWRDARLIVETDGRAAHDTRAAFRDDRRRDRELMLHGWQVGRFAWQEVCEEPAQVVRFLRASLPSTWG